MWFIALFTLILASIVYYLRKNNPTGGHASIRDCQFGFWDYSRLRNMISTNRIPLPAMFVNLDVFDDNVRILADMAKTGGKSLRMATKSIRCPFLIHRILDKGGRTMKGFMCYSVQEATFLAKEGHDDFYIPYPTVQICDINEALKLMESGKKITITVDSLEHIHVIDQICTNLMCSGQKITDRVGVSIDLDLSFKLLSGLMQLGAHRSKVDSVQIFSQIVKAIKQSNHIRLAGVMGYEAHVAGLPDDNPVGSLPNLMVRFLKKLFFKKSLDLRGQVMAYCLQENIKLEFFNGGGTGNLKDVSRDPAITEVTAGSGFLQAQLFDYYVDNHCSPAICFALQATRIKSNYIVCQSGGFVASGSCSLDKFPKPFANPTELRHFSDEGYGEIQTPLQITGQYHGSIKLGDPVFFRPAKSGEIAEHFNKYYLIQNYEIIDKVQTYRGTGHIFY